MKSLQQILAFTAGISVLLPGVSAGPLPARGGVLEKYSLVLDSVFPAHWDQCSASRLSLGMPQITIRILPSFSQELQLVICRVQPGQFFVVSSTLDPKEASVWDHMLTERRIDDRTSETVSTSDSVEEISASIHVIHKSCKLDSRVVDGWFRKLATVRMSLPLLGGGLDGTTYEVTLQNGEDVMQARIWVWKQQKPLTTLVENIMGQIEKADCSEIQAMAKKTEGSELRCFGNQRWPRMARLNIPQSETPSTVPAWTPNPIIRHCSGQRRGRVS